MAVAHAPDEAAIREQAYYLWEQDGRPGGREMEYWQRATVLAAEKTQLDTLTKAPPKRAVGKAKAAAAVPKVKAAAAKPKVKAAASKLKAAPTKTAKPDSKGKPKKK